MKRDIIPILLALCCLLLAACKKSTSKNDFIKSCKKLDFKAIMRNPENYIGQNFYVTCYILSIRTSILSNGYGLKYCIAYEFDLDEAREEIKKGWYDSLMKTRAYDLDKSIWCFDTRNENSKNYVKILEKDIVTIYGTFNGLTTSRNSLTNETQEEMSLNIKYVDLIEE